MFVKDHAYYIDHVADEIFLSQFRHSFIIRHPRHALPSYFYVWPDVSFFETGYQGLANLFHKVAVQNDEPPVLIEADELVRDPAGIVEKYCRRMHTPFKPDSLTWEPRNRVNNNPWHTGLSKSRGFENSANPEYESIDGNSRLQELYQRCLPYYEDICRYKF